MFDAHILSGHVQRALQRGQVKAAVISILRNVPADERAPILIDLLAETEAEPMVAAAAATRPSKEVSAAPVEAPKSKDQGASVADRLLGMLREQPGVSISELAQALYGASGAAAKNRVSTALTYLKRKGKVEVAGRGQWRPVGPKKAPKQAPAKAARRAPAPKAAAKAKQAPVKAEKVAAQSGPERVRSVLKDHPEGLTTAQMREILGANQPPHISTVVAKMAASGALVVSGQKGHGIYKLSDASSKSGSESEG